MFWDKLKPKAPEARPASIEVAPTGEVVIAWDDGKTSRWRPSELRLACPCAACVDEWTGRRTLQPEQVAADVRVLAMEPVGNYAVQIRWSDGHDTGLYPWTLLRPPT
jgi:DUF971 family protein